jgi:hypothetical protein
MSPRRERVTSASPPRSERSPRQVASKFQRVFAIQTTGTRFPRRARRPTGTAARPGSFGSAVRPFACARTAKTRAAEQQYRSSTTFGYHFWPYQHAG